MSEMIERVAAAIMEADNDRDEDWRVMARAAIEAMREPTRGMVDACDVNIPTEGMILGVWGDMIDAALSDEKPQSDVREGIPEVDDPH